MELRSRTIIGVLCMHDVVFTVRTCIEDQENAFQIFFTKLVEKVKL